MADAARVPAAPDVVCIGAALWDLIGRSAGTVTPGADVPGRILRAPGGVALNVASQLARRGLRPALLAAVGRDPDGDALAGDIAARGIDTRYLTRDSGRPTDIYMAIEDAGGLVGAIADTSGLDSAGASILAPLSDGLAGDAGPWRGPVVLDGNLPPAVLAQAAAELSGADLRVVAVGSGKASRLAPLLRAPGATLYLNLAEARALLPGTGCADAAAAAQALVALGAARVLVTDGARSAAFADRRTGARLAAVPPAVTLARVTGAGDCFVAAHLAAERGGADAAAALDAAVAAAAAHVAGKDTP